MSADPGDRADLIVLGAGPGGYAAAFRAADEGLDVTLIDPEAEPGGVCLHRGCIPSKALLHAARVMGEAREARRWGITYPEPEIDLSRLRSWRNDVVGKLTSGLGSLIKARRIRHLRGLGKFVDSERIQVTGHDGNERTLRYGQAIVATGSSPSMLPGLPEKSRRILNSTSALALEEIPGSLLVVGGGYIGLELGSVYAALGSRVTVVEMEISLLPGVDSDLVRSLARRLEGSFDEILTATKVARFEESSDGVRVTLEGKGIESPERTFDRVLIAVGRRPSSGGLGLERTRAEIDEKGFIAVDESRRTADSRIFAIGDVAGQPMLAHKATHEGRIAAEVIAGSKAVYEPRAVPAVVFTDPEIAWCGLTEGEAKAEGRQVVIRRFPWSASGRALTMDRPEGVTKLIMEPGTGRVLGVGLCGAGAGEMIGEGVLAVEMAATAADLSLSIHAHPTLSESIMETAELFFGSSTHVLRRPKQAREGQS